MYKRFIEIGRVALINDGPDRGKLCVIIDIVDQRRVGEVLDNLLTLTINVFILGLLQNNDNVGSTGKKGTRNPDYSWDTSITFGLKL